MSSNHAPIPSRIAFPSETMIRQTKFRLATISMATVLIAAGALCAVPVAAQDDGVVTQGELSTADGDPQSDTAADQEPAASSLRIDLSVTVPRGDVNEAQAQACEDDADAGQISGEIVVCRRLGEDNGNYFSGSREAAQKRYAQETAFKGDLTGPDVAGGGIFRGPATVSGLCVIPPCPPEAALLIDVEALPQAPPGSDADRIARGLPPLGQDDDLSEEEIRRRREALGLPPPAFEKRPR